MWHRVLTVAPIGTNAHVILENFVTSTKSHQQQDSEPYRQLTLFNFSAASETSLRTLLAGYSSHLQSHPETSLKDLAHTLHTRRSDHALRITISARSTPDLAARIGSILANDNKGIGIQTKLLPHPPRILGIFTGQGAQWARMGKELVMNIPQLREAIQDMDAMLQNLPAPERPSWSLLEELLRDAETSRISTAIIGQPLCTMIQLLLCDLLSIAGINFESVVGHSGGEVGAAYAAGIICREDALKIAYFRGLITDLNPSDLPGGMMAIGTSTDEAYELCDMLDGRVEVAAINSPSSITIAGDLDAINKGKEALDADKKFARVLKVDKAYHSRHMLPAGQKYVEALKSTKIRVQRPRNDCPVWYSSVFENRVMGADDDLAAQYWTDNMVRPVLFSHALACATENTTVDLAIEVGPHPTLKGPALQTLPPELPYTGVLSRSKDDLEAFSDSLGYMWSHISPSIVDFGRCDSLVYGLKTRKLVTGLPTYPWDHQTAFWHSSRASKNFLHPRFPPSPLLGSWSTDVVDGEMRWRNSLRLNEHSWIRDHKLQGQIVFPAAAYLSTAIEAAQHLVPREEHITMIEVEDFAITRPLVFKEGDNGIETIFTLSDIVRDKDGSYAASFRHHACSGSDTNTPSNHATGRIVVTVGEPSSDLLPQITACPPNTVSVSEEHFYASLVPLGYTYNGSFRSVSSIKRKLDFASTTVTVPVRDEEPNPMLLHPGLLESTLQGMLLAYAHPHDGSLEEMYVLNGVKRFRVNVPLCNQELLPDSDLLTCAHLTAGSATGKQLSGDADIYSVDGTGLIQFECVQLVPLVGPTPDNDRRLFAEQRWDLASPSAQLAMGGAQATAEDHDLANAVERICLHYMKQTLAQFPASIRQNLNLPWHFACLFDFFSHIVNTTRNVTRRWVDPEWFADTDEDIAVLKKRYADCVDVRLACAVGNNLSSVLRGETTMLEHMTKDNLLDQFYAEGLAMREYSTYLARTVKQLVHRYAGMNILEIGKSTPSEQTIFSID
jgi:hybrid polyketide synthase/nonribosomal peptide synthetase ACE1